MGLALAMVDGWSSSFKRFLVRYDYVVRSRRAVGWCSLARPESPLPRLDVPSRDGGRREAMGLALAMVDGWSSSFKRFLVRYDYVVRSRRAVGWCSLARPESPLPRLDVPSRDGGRREAMGLALAMVDGWSSSFKRFLVRYDYVVRSYQRYYTGSHQNSAVKRAWARIVLGWVTSREVLVLHPPSPPPFLDCLFRRDGSGGVMGGRGLFSARGGRLVPPRRAVAAS